MKITKTNLAITMLTFLFVGCTDGSPDVRELVHVSGITTPPQETLKSPVTIVAWHAQEVARLRSSLQSAEANYKGAKAAAEEARREGQHRLLGWVTGVLTLAAIALTVAAFFIPAGKRWMLTASAACGAGAAVAKVWAAFWWLMPWIGGGIMLFVFIGVVWHLRRSQVAMKIAAELADNLEGLIDGKGEQVEYAKMIAQDKQGNAKVSLLTQTMRGK